MRMSLSVALVIAFFCVLEAQTPQVFDVASVKPNKSGEAATSLGFQRGGRFQAVNESLWRLIAEAYGKAFQLDIPR